TRKAHMLRFRDVVYRTVVALLFVAVSGAAQSDQSEPAFVADPQIAAALRQISAQRIQANIEKLVSFGTRSTISAQDPASIAAGQEIGAAGEGIRAEFGAI